MLTLLETLRARLHALHSASLQEAGRAISANSQAKIQTAIDNLTQLIAQEETDENDAPKLNESERRACSFSDERHRVLESAILIEAELSFDEKREAIQRALHVDRKQADGSYIYRYIEDAYDTSVIYCEYASGSDSASRLFQVEYSIDANGVATLGTPIEVREETKYVPVSAAVTESSALYVDFVALKERAIGADGTMRIKVIAPGKGSSGYYKESVLKRDVPNVFKAGLHMYADHQTEAEAAERPENRVANLAAVLVSDAVYLEAGPDGPGGYADVKPFAEYKPMLEDKAEHIGVSINAFGTTKIEEVDGERQLVVESIEGATSVDFVTRAGAGGKILSLKESVRLKESTKNQPLTNQTLTKPNLQEKSTMNEAEETKLRESLSTQETENARLRESLILRDARDYAHETLSADEYKSVPQITRERIAESQAKNPVVKDGALDKDAFKAKIEEAVKTEIEYLNAIHPTGQIAGMGSADATIKESKGVVIPARVALGL